MKNIILRVSDREHRLLWNQKEALAIFRAKPMSWEDFFVLAKNKKIERGN